MKLSSVKKFIAAADAAKIKKYQFDTDLGTHLYHGDRDIIVIDEGEEVAVNIRKKLSGPDPYDGQIRIYAADLVDIHEVRIGGTLPQIVKFLEAYGISLDEEDTKTLLKIQGSNYDIKPLTGDYLVFKEKTEEELAKLTPEQREEYEKALKAYEEEQKQKGLTQGVSAQISV